MSKGASCTDTLPESFASRGLSHFTPPDTLYSSARIPVLQAAVRGECRVVMAGEGGGDDGWGAGVEAASAVVSGILQWLTCEGSHLLFFLPLGVGNVQP